MWKPSQIGRSSAAGAEHEVDPAERALLGEEGAGARLGVARRIHRHGDRRHVVPELVERAAHGLGLRRAGVLAVGVEEGHDHRLPAQRAHRDRVAVLVAQLEVGSLEAARHHGALERAAAARRLVVVRSRPAASTVAAEREHGHEHERDRHAGIHLGEGSSELQQRSAPSGSSRPHGERSLGAHPHEAGSAVDPRRRRELAEGGQLDPRVARLARARERPRPRAAGRAPARAPPDGARSGRAAPGPWPSSAQRDRADRLGCRPPRSRGPRPSPGQPRARQLGEPRGHRGLEASGRGRTRPRRRARAVAMTAPMSPGLEAGADAHGRQSRALGLDQPATHRVARHLHAVAHAELREHVRRGATPPSSRTP